MPGNVIVTVIDSRDQAEKTLQRLHQAGCNSGHLSMVAKDAVEGSLSGWQALTLSGIGTVMVAGPLADWILAAVRNEDVFGGLRALGAALYGLGITKGAASRYEAAVKNGKILAIAHGATDELQKAREILLSSAYTLD